MAFDNKTEEFIQKIFSKYNHVTKKSHFVKQEYLKNWSHDKNKVLASRDGGPYFPTITENICHERYMYKLELLTDNELLQIRQFYSKSPQVVKDINNNFLIEWQLCCVLLKNIESECTNTILDKELLKKMLIQAGEDLQTNLESAYTDKIKNGLLSCNESFLKDDDEKLNFCIFLFSQYLRTQKKKQAIIENFKNTNNKDFTLNPERIWKVLVYVMTHMAAFNFLCKDDIHIKFLKCSNNVLITGDQPIVNILEGEGEIEKFYFPVTPTIGLIFPSEQNDIIVDNIDLINEMNDRIKKSSIRYTIKYNGK